jgi:phosphoribosylformylglycinamidine synthase
VPVHKVVVDVMLKPEILDPAGQAVANALPTLGFAPATSLRIGKHVELELEAEDEAGALEQATQMAEVLLSNPVIEDYRVSLASTG